HGTEPNERVSGAVRALRACASRGRFAGGDFAPRTHARVGEAIQQGVSNYEENTMRRQNAPRNTLSGIRDLELQEQAVDPLPESWRPIDRAADGGRFGASPARTGSTGRMRLHNDFAE